MEMSVAALSILLAFISLAAGSPLKPVFESEDGLVTWPRAWRLPESTAAAAAAPTGTASPCIVDGMCCGTQTSRCCSGGAHRTDACSKNNYRCGCLPDGNCTLGGASDCCSGLLHATTRCLSGQRCGCLPGKSCRRRAPIAAKSTYSGHERHSRLNKSYT